MTDYAGKTCKACGKNIWAGDEVATCPSCGETYHKMCWENMAVCKNCGKKTGHEEGDKFDKYVAERREVLQEAKEKSTRQADHTKVSSEIWTSVYSGGLFSNIGSKLKTVAWAITLLGIALGILLVIVLGVMDEDLIILGLLIGLTVAVISWISSFALYGFGELISSSQKTVWILSEILKNKKE